ncbi:kinase-like protein, partial [Trichodelitschia bisporula]
MECMRNHFIDGALLDGRFRTLSPLNHGSFGMVFKALDTATGELVALKCLTKPSAANTCPQMIAVDDRSEELAIHKLVGAHPNIVNLVHHFETEHHVYIVLEYCSNGDLYEAIRIGRGPGQTENVREAMFQLVDAVQYMHSKGVYHRDIKPENIFLDKNGTLKIGDFGLATMDRWSYEAAVGSDRYMAPEQYDPANCGYSPAKADIWAIGICMLNILFSRNPFATPTVSDPLFSDFAHDNQSLFDVFPNMSQDTFEVIVSCLALDPAKRSLSAVRSALQRAVAFTTDEEPLDDFCVEDPTVVETTSTREPLRTPSISTPHLDQNGAFPWAKALALTPPVRQLSAIPDTENSDDFELFPSDPQSDWYSVSGSIPSFVDSGLGFSLKSDKLSGYVAMKSTRPKAVPKTSGSLPISMARPIPSMASVFGKKREAVSKSWSDLWDEDAEEEQVLFEELDHDLVFLRSGEDDKVWEADLPEDPITPRPALKELKNLDSVNNSRSHSPKASSKRARETPRDKEHVSEFTGFVFEEHNEDGTSSSALSNVPRYSPPSKRSMVDKWAALGDRRRAVP